MNENCNSGLSSHLKELNSVNFNSFYSQKLILEEDIIFIYVTNNSQVWQSCKPLNYTLTVMAAWRNVVKLWADIQLPVRMVSSLNTVKGTGYLHWSVLSFFSIPYILESNPHTFYSFSELKIQMLFRIACVLDSRS